MPEEDEELGPLPAGRHGLSREQVAHHQRERVIAGLAVAVAERGYSAVTITDITQAASVSRRTFYEHFETKEECFLAAFDVLVDHLRELIDEATAPVADWPKQVIAALRTLLRFFASEPDLARLCMVESLGAGPAVGQRFREAIREFVPALERGRAERSGARPLPPSTEDSLIGAVASVISRSIAGGEAASLEALLPDLAEFVLMPYLGTDGAQRLAGEAA